MAEWVARVYRSGKVYRVVVDGLLQFDVGQLAGIEERTAELILARLRMSYPSRAAPGDPATAERVMTFELCVRSSPPANSKTRPSL